MFRSMKQFVPTTEVKSDQPSSDTKCCPTAYLCKRAKKKWNCVFYFEKGVPSSNVNAKGSFFTLCIFVFFVFVYLTLRKVCQVRKSKQQGILLLGLFPIWEPPLFDETCISIWPRA